MTSQDPAAWARAHKKEFAKRLIDSSGATPDNRPSAIFMAGLPGVGKTEFTKNLIKNANLAVVRLDMDEIAAQIETYSPEIADRFREGATILLERAFDLVLEKKLNFIMDGTFGGPKAIDNIRRTIAKGYIVKIVYIKQSPDVAWEYTKAREKVEHRAIDRKGFLTSASHTLSNLQQVVKKYGEKISVDIIFKNEENKIVRWDQDATIKDIDQIVKEGYN